MTGSKIAVNLMDYMPTVSPANPPAGTKRQPKRPDPAELALFKAQYRL
jgi:hypothetical protein